jgi:hypothetical protein
MESVRRDEVVRYWLAREVEKGDDVETGDGSGVEPYEVTADEALDALLRRKPGAASAVWRAPPTAWYRLDLSRSRFESLRVVRGPERLGWGALSGDGTVLGAARRVAGGDPDALERETGVDVWAILDYRSAVAADGDVGSLVLSTRRGRAPWHVADGNHRATARALHLVETGAYDPQPAFLGVGGNPVLRPLRERLGGIVDRLRGAERPLQG